MDAQPAARPQVQPCRYKVGKTLGAGSYSVVKECVSIENGRYYAAKVINKRLMAGREHMVSAVPGRLFRAVPVPSRTLSHGILASAEGQLAREPC